jgi:hypothetical protein
LGYIYARCLQSGGGQLPDYLSEYHRTTIEKLFLLLSHRNLGVTVAAARAIGNIGRFAPLPIPDKAMDVDGASADASISSLTKETLITKMASLLKNPTSERRLTERVATALGIKTCLFFLISVRCLIAALFRLHLYWRA